MKYLNPHIALLGIGREQQIEALIALDFADLKAKFAQLVPIYTCDLAFAHIDTDVLGRCACAMALEIGQERALQHKEAPL